MANTTVGYGLVNSICFSEGKPEQKKISLWLILVFLSMGGVFSGVKNNSKNFENKKI